MASDAEYESGSTRCVVCGSDLRDPKKRGDPDVNGDWVCSSVDCRIIHEPEMTCNIVRGSL